MDDDDDPDEEVSGDRSDVFETRLQRRNDQCHRMIWVGVVLAIAAGGLGLMLAM